MKKLIALLLTLALAFGLLAGCAANSEPAAPEADTADTPTQEVPQEEKDSTPTEKQILKLMSVGTSAEQAYIDTLTAAVDAFNADNEYNVEIQIEWYENDAYTTKLTTLMTQNEVPDIFFAWGSGYLKPYVEADRVLSLTPYMDADPEWAGRFYDGTLSSTTYNGEVYAVPSTQTVGTIYYNKAIFDSCGLQAPTTWDEFANVCKVLNENSITPIALGGAASWVVAYYMGMIQGGTTGPEAYNGLFDGTTTWMDAYTDAFKAYQEVAAMGAFSDNYLGISYDEAREEFAGGSAAMYPMGTWDTAAVISGLGGEDAVGVFFMPPKTEGLKPCTVAQMDKIYAVSATCTNADAALAFLKTLTTPEYQGKLVLDTGALPVADADTSAGTIDAVTQAVMAGMPNVTSVLPTDAFGDPISSEIMNVCVAVANGENAEEQAAYMQEFAESQG